MEAPNTTFILEDGGEELGGFNDPVVLPPMDEEVTETPEVEAPVEGSEPAPEPEVNEEVQPEPEPAPEPAPVAEPQADPTALELAALRAEVNRLKQVKQAPEKAPQAPKPPVVKYPTQDDWINDPSKAAEMLTTANTKMNEFNVTQMLNQRFSQYQQTTSANQTRQKASETAVSTFPELKNPASPLRKTADLILQNKDLGIGNSPQAPLIAALMAAQILSRQTTSQPQALQQATSSGVAAEKSRQQRLAANPMHKGDKGGGSVDIPENDPEVLAFTRKTGMSAKDVIKLLKEVEGKGAAKL